MTVLNTPAEITPRVLILMDRYWPAPLNFNALAILDHALLHSADFGGPPSLHPETFHRAGELALKRPILQECLHLLIQNRLVEVHADLDGIRYQASDSARSFLRLLRSAQAGYIRERAMWIHTHFGNTDDAAFREEMAQVISPWDSEFQQEEWM